MLYLKEFVNTSIWHLKTIWSTLTKCLKGNTTHYLRSYTPEFEIFRTTLWHKGINLKFHTMCKEK